MKKILYSLLLAVIAVGVMSCNSFEDEAKAQMKKNIPKCLNGLGKHC